MGSQAGIEAGFIFTAKGGERLMEKMLRYMRTKLQDVKGEVSVEWVLVAVIMAIIIVLAFSPTVQSMLENGIGKIQTQITNAS